MKFYTLCIILVVLLLILCIVWIYRPEHFIDSIHERITCSTRNMSMDLRGEAYYPPREILSPFHNSSIGVLDPKMCPQKKIFT
jgi:hypothetical protein